MLNRIDKICALELIKTIFNRGLVITVANEDEIVIEKSEVTKDILKALAKGRSDYLYLYDKRGRKRGAFSLVYNSGSREPIDLIGGYSIDLTCEEIWDSVDEVVSSSDYKSLKIR